MENETKKTQARRLRRPAALLAFLLVATVMTLPIAVAASDANDQECDDIRTGDPVFGVGTYECWDHFRLCGVGIWIDDDGDGQYDPEQDDEIAPCIDIHAGS